ncbi:MAG: DNA mismatch repair endonuclease MutL, partial [Oscillospiraceae bacterium]|nr:DNA mismatch repair endonuclease MutL [Oscillospiraceae bacterium]
MGISRIIELSPHVADLIAAGEVAERPASVVKELLENSIDAGAAAVTVEIRNGGATSIRVSDDGGGIAREDVRRAFLRHATSKLRDAEGLEAIGTLGFRGEALAAIAAVSRVELLTRAAGENEGTRLMLDGGKVVEESPAARPEGTAITVRDLFYNTPARLKFMKTDRAEGAGVSAAVIRCALSHPEVSVRYIRDGKEELHTPGDSRLDSCVYSAAGREFAAGLLSVSAENDGVAVTGFITKISALRGNRNHQFFFVNGRFVKSKTMQAALEQAYKNSMFTGRFPACVLYLTVPAGTVDVNVHPAKTEVKFLFEKQVFDCVYYAALSALAEDAPPIQAAGCSPIQAAAAASESESEFAPPARTQRDALPGAAAREPVFNSGGFVSRVPSFPERTSSAPVRDGTAAPYRADGTRAILPPEPAYRVIGETLGTYILVEAGESLWLIDKHAAHERIHFDRLKNEPKEVMAQSLLTPVAASLGGEDAALLLENAELLGRMGFLIESFGENAVAARQIPSDIDLGDAESALAGICAALRAGGLDEDARRDEIFASVACKAAIKSGRSSEPRELEALAGRVMRGEVRYCPHG